MGSKHNTIETQQHKFKEYISQTSLLTAICHSLPSATGRWTLCVSCALGQQVVSETQHTMVVTQVTLTVTTNNCGLVKRTIWQSLKAKLHILYQFLLTLYSTTLLLHRFLRSQTAEAGQRSQTVHALIARLKK